jgi:hypothetical protein
VAMIAFAYWVLVANLVSHGHAKLNAIVAWGRLLWLCVLWHPDVDLSVSAAQLTLVGNVLDS